MPELSVLHTSMQTDSWLLSPGIFRSKLNRAWRYVEHGRIKLLASERRSLCVPAFLQHFMNFLKQSNGGEKNYRKLSALRLNPSSNKNSVYLFSSYYHLMALGLSLQLLLIVKREPVQHGVLLFIHRGHGALAVDLVYVDFSLSFQHSGPPHLSTFTQRQLKERKQRWCIIS